MNTSIMRQSLYLEFTTMDCFVNEPKWLPKETLELPTDMRPLILKRFSLFWNVAYCPATHHLQIRRDTPSAIGDFSQKRWINKY